MPAEAEVERSLKHIVNLAKMGASIGYKAVQEVLRQLESHPILVESRTNLLVKKMSHSGYYIKFFDMSWRMASPEEVRDDNIIMSE